MYTYAEDSVDGSSKYSVTAGTSFHLGIYPDSYERALEEDISIKHLYNVDAKTGKKDTGNITIGTLLSHIPAITIREYIPDTRLNSTLNYMTKFYSIIKGLFEKSKD